jgi:hypothetical protein
VKSDWTHLLDPASQPATLRASYELLEDFAAALRLPAEIDAEALAPDVAVRLGYLLAAFRFFADAPVHASWFDLETRLRHRRDASLPLGNTVLFRADASRNPLDDLASAWGLRKGLDPRKVKEIVAYGAT